MPEDGVPDRSKQHILTKSTLLCLTALRVSIFSAATTVQMLSEKWVKTVQNIREKDTK